jgi:hypothetical protein
MPTGDFWWLFWPCAVVLAYVAGVATALIGVRRGAEYMFKAKFAPLGLEFDQPKPDAPKGAPVSYCPDLAMDEGYEVFNEPKPSEGAQRFRKQFTGSALAFIKGGGE